MGQSSGKFRDNSSQHSLNRRRETLEIIITDSDQEDAFDDIKDRKVNFNSVPSIVSLSLESLNDDSITACPSLTVSNSLTQTTKSKQNRKFYSQINYDRRKCYDSWIAEMNNNNSTQTDFCHEDEKTKDNLSKTERSADFKTVTSHNYSNSGDSTNKEQSTPQKYVISRSGDTWQRLNCGRSPPHNHARMRGLSSRVGDNKIKRSHLVNNSCIDDTLQEISESDNFQKCENNQIYNNFLTALTFRYSKQKQRKLDTNRDDDGGRSDIETLTSVTELSKQDGLHSDRKIDLINNSIHSMHHMQAIQEESIIDDNESINKGDSDGYTDDNSTREEKFERLMKGRKTCRSLPSLSFSTNRTKGISNGAWNFKDTKRLSSSNAILEVNGNFQEMKRSAPNSFKVYCYKFWVNATNDTWRAFYNPRDRRIESIGRLSACRIHLTKNTMRHNSGLIKRQVVIYASTLSALEKCCKLFDDKFPTFYASAGLNSTDLYTSKACIHAGANDR